MKTLKPNATHLALALVLIGLRPAIAGLARRDLAKPRQPGAGR